MNKVLNTLKITGLGIILSYAGLLTGCTDPKEVASMRPIDNKWKTTAERKSLFETITFSRRDSKLTASDKNALLSLKNKMRVGMPIYARLLVPHGETTREAKQIGQRVHEIEAYLVQLGLKKSHIEIKRRQAVVASERSALTIVFDQYHLILPKCPGWEGVRPSSMPHGEEGFGCAMAYNMGLMISNPKDLYDAQGLDVGDGPYSSGAIDRYRKDKTKEVKVEKVGKSSGS